MCRSADVFLVVVCVCVCVDVPCIVCVRRLMKAEQRELKKKKQQKKLLKQQVSVHKCSLSTQVRASSDCCTCEC